MVFFAKNYTDIVINLDMSLRKLLFIGGGAIVGAKIGIEMRKKHQERISKMTPAEFGLYKSKQNRSWKTAGTIFKWYIILMILFLVLSLLVVN